MIEPTVLFATDLDGDVQSGLRVATRLAAQRGATLLIVHVAPLSSLDGEGMLIDSAALLTGSARRALRRLQPSDPSVPYLSIFRVGEPEAEIAALAAEHDAELIVVPVKRRGTFARLFRPSLAERLADRVSCPVVSCLETRGAPPPPLAAAPTSLRPIRALEVVLGARVHALRTLLEARQHAAAQLASRPSVQAAVASLVNGARAHRRPSALDRQIRDELVLELSEHQRALGALGVEITAELPGERSGAPLRVTLLRMGTRPLTGAPREALLERAFDAGLAVSLPTCAATDDRPVVVAAARAPLSKGAAAVVSLTFDGRPGFLRILAQPGPTPSAETYAFDERGVMLSNSRFPDQLRRVGLLPAHEPTQTPGLLRVCDPGASLLDAPARPSSEWPLTRMAASATTGHDGSDARGYRDYRGVDVIGAWRWLPEYGFGVAAEMDHAEAS